MVTVSNVRNRHVFHSHRIIFMDPDFFFSVSALKHFQFETTTRTALFMIVIVVTEVVVVDMTKKM